MKNFKRVMVLFIAMMSVGVSCSKVEKVRPPLQYKSSEAVVTTETQEQEFSQEQAEAVDVSGQTITWLADFDLNPAENEQRSCAVALFEDVYGAKINFVSTTNQDKFTKLSEMINSGEEVDMFPYDASAFPIGVVKDQYQPLDPYFDILGINDNSGLWDDMLGTINKLEYDGQHYVIPYDLSNPVVITYSRKLMKENKLDDPYELYLKGEWDYDVMMKMMKKFVDNNSGYTRYGINGSFGQSLLQCTGGTIVTYEDGVFSNNIKSSEIESAGKFMQKLSEQNLVDRSYIGHFPMDNSSLFFAMGSWSLGESNALNPDSDLMIVPFPKSPDSDEYYITCDFNAKMLVKNSTKGEAVAAYIKCERLAATEEKYDSDRKKQALAVKKSASGKVKSFITEEQYDALQSYLDTENFTPAFDFAYGMGEEMNNQNSHRYASRGAANNIAEALLNGSVTSWKTLQDEQKKAIDNCVKEFNK